MSQPRSGPRLLLTDREGALLLERARVHVEGDRIVYHAADDEMMREYNIPHANLAVLFLGQGTSITQEAVRLLAEEGVHVAFTGSGGTPLHFGALTTYHATRHFRAILPVYLDPARSLAAAKAVMAQRIKCITGTGVKHMAKWMAVRSPDAVRGACTAFEKALANAASIEQLLGYEGQFSKALYAAFSRAAKLAEGESGFRREAGANQRDTTPALINSLIDHGNYLCYGMAGAALWALGIPPHLPVFHGKTRAGGLVFDLADAFKDAFVLPAAFAAARRKPDADPEAAFRVRIITAFDDEAVLALAIRTVGDMIEAGSGWQAATP